MAQRQLTSIEEVQRVQMLWLKEQEKRRIAYEQYCDNCDRMPGMLGVLASQRPDLVEAMRKQVVYWFFADHTETCNILALICFMII